MTEKQHKLTEGRGCASKKVDIIHSKYFDDYMSVFHLALMMLRRRNNRALSKKLILPLR